ncbi:alpha/beta fold hydrolase [Actinoalloteichus caeruleus]|uniref:alpha/beta fold hydrolase n=1 Tax=Actinoalloteichus cyanogriseus TaxID=2893586 RepID=UPI0004AB0A20|nr:alpha/beta fold hydrolase [Actinoalloteichus caeruleus]
MAAENGTFVHSGPVRLWARRVGDVEHPPVLLVMGTSASSVLWPPELVDRLLAAGCQVVLFDHRDTGLSDTVDFERDPYTVADMAGDCLAVLDAFGIASAHVVGMSLGGTICQWLAVHRPDRVRGLTAVMTSPLGEDPEPAWRRALAGQDPDPGALPPPAPRFLRHLAARAETGGETRADRVESATETWRVLHGEVLPFDEAEARRVSALGYDRDRDPNSGDNHALAGRMTEDRRVDLSRIAAPTLVVHGTEDPVHAVEHGRRLAALIPGARLRVVPGMGHGLFSPGLPTTVADLVAGHVADVERLG